MKILYDHQIFTLQNYGGISRYFAELINCFGATEAAECKVSLVSSNNRYLLDYGLFRPSYLARKMGHIHNKRIQYSINKANSRIALSRGQYDIFHPTYYDVYFLRHIKNKPYVLTIYDMIHELYPELFHEKDKTAEYKRILANNAAKIISISENTKKDILKFYDIDSEKIEVIYLGCSVNRCSEIKVPHGIDRVSEFRLKLPERYILFVGNRYTYKNFFAFVDSVASILKSDNTLFLVCAGSGDFSPSEFDYFQRLAIRHKVIHTPADDFLLSHLYQKAILFVFPSQYEGFGLPILESFSCGCPVALSESSSFPEIAKDAAVYFDPTSKSSMEESISRVIYNEGLRDILIRRGYNVVRNFSWEKTSRKTLNLYENII
ncbi:MAG: glycosyltransferase family 1 protein [Methanothrix sp.]